MKLFAAGLALLLAGCAFEAQDIDGWQGVLGGQERLAGYLADAERPLDLRMRAARGLFTVDRLDAVMGVMRQAPPPDQALLLTGLVEMAREILAAGGEDAGRGAALGYYLLEFSGQMSDPAPLAKAVASWGVAQLPLGRGRPPINPAHAILAALVAAEAETLPVLLEAASAAEGEERLLAVVEVLDEVPTAEVRAAAAALLLSRARARHPDVSFAFVQAMLRTRNPTLLRYLMELARDPRLDMRVRAVGFDAARHLGADALPGLLRILRTDLPANDDARWLSLRAAWVWGGPAWLETALPALPADGRWPEQGAEFRDLIDDFCDNRVAEKAAEARPVLVGLLEEPNWVARAFAMECIIRLYPDDARALLAPLRKDLTPLPGFADGEAPATFASVIEALARR